MFIKVIFFSYLQKRVSLIRSEHLLLVWIQCFFLHYLFLHNFICAKAQWQQVSLFGPPWATRHKLTAQFAQFLFQTVKVYLPSQCFTLKSLVRIMKIALFNCVSLPEKAQNVKTAATVQGILVANLCQCIYHFHQNRKLLTKKFIACGHNVIIKSTQTQ